MESTHVSQPHRAEVGGGVGSGVGGKSQMSGLQPPHSPGNSFPATFRQASTSV